MNSLPDTSTWPLLGAPGRNACRVSDEMVDLRRPQRQTCSARMHALPQRLLFDVNRTALIIIDMQNDFCARDGWIAGLGIDVSPALALVEPINRASAALRSLNVPVVWVSWGVRPDLLNLSPGTQHPFNPGGHGPGLGGEVRSTRRTHRLLQQGSWGAQIIDDLVQGPHDVHVSKHRISGFWDTPLDAILRNLDVTTLLFAGVNTDHCVLATLMDANFQGYDTILLQDCTCTTSPDICYQATLHNVRFCFGFTATSRELVEAVSAAG